MCKVSVLLPANLREIFNQYSLISVLKDKLLLSLHVNIYLVMLPVVMSCSSRTVSLEYHNTLPQKLRNTRTASFRTQVLPLTRFRSSRRRWPMPQTSCYGNTNNSILSLSSLLVIVQVN